MAEQVIQEILAWILIILFIVIFLFIVYSPKEGFMGKIAKLALGIEKYLPMTPSKELKKDETIPAKVAQTQNSFIENIRKYINQPTKAYCRVAFDLSSMEGYSMELSNSDGINSKILKEEKYGYKKVSEIKLAGANICTINAGNFYDCFIGKPATCNNLYNKNSIITVSKNKINNQNRFAPFVVRFPNTDDFCFIPLKDEWFWQYKCNRNEDSLDGDCLKEIEKLTKAC